MCSFRHTRFDATVYQCSACQYTSTIRTNVTSHIGLKCPSARVVSEKCTLFTRPLGEKELCVTRTNTIEGDHNVQDNSTTINVFPMVYAGSEEERRRLFDIFKDPEALRELANRDPEEIPATMFRMWKGADAPVDMKNIEVVGDRVREHRSKSDVVSVPRAKFIKQTIGDMFHAVVAAHPDTTADPPRLQKIHQDLYKKELKLGKKRYVSRLDAVEMHVSGSREAYDLGTDARQFLKQTTQLVDTELKDV